jgi:DNA-binding NarL/FixJ family response regulator
MEIFLVEDSALVRARLAETLGGIEGAHIAGEADRAEAAIRGILAARPDVVLLDINLAGGDSGFDVLRAVRREAPEIDVYMLSNFAARPYREIAQRLGARGFFDKSNELQRLFHAVAHWRETPPCLP